MRSEAKKSLRHGFLLTEQEIRRLADTIVQQMRRIDPEGRGPIQYTAKLKGGAIIETNALDDVLALENAGAKTIVRLGITAKDRQEQPQSEITVQFANVDEEQGGDSTSVEYTVRSDDRDWVFVTSSELDERIAKVKRFAPNQMGRNAIFIVFMIVMIVTFALMAILSGGSHTRLDAISAVEKAWIEKRVTDPVEALIQVEKAANTPGRYERYGEFAIPVLPMVVIVLIFVATPVIPKFYPFFVFCWGDYVRIYERKQAVRRFVFVVVVLGLALSVAGSLIASRIHSGH